ncbi:hypothetical protein M885DRAFT_522094 [Pelagophyceae sp. CCMP2097]|nr:hypothetical protein M885DRAFT_522094 [Pelagophyceae sp. CCMP2097]
MEQTLWQTEAALCRFDDDVVRFRLAKAKASSDPQQAAAVPFVVGTSDAYYDPEHPQADWSGMVPRGSSGRRAVGGRAANVTVERSLEGGIVPARGFEQVPEPGKKKYSDDGRFQTEAQRAQRAGTGFHGDAHQAHDQYVSASMAAMRGEQTPQAARDVKNRPGKRMVRPAYEAATAHEAATVYAPRASPFATDARPPRSYESGSLAGYRAPQLNAGAKFLSHADIAAAVEREPEAKQTGKWTNKELLTQNYAGAEAIVGYSGVRRR